MSETKLLTRLRSLEIELHKPYCRSNAERLDELLHESFFEIGRSGRRWDKSAILSELPTEKLSYTIVSERFSVQVVAEQIVLLSYLSANKSESGKLSRYTARTSLWEETNQGWKMRFHQGTATSEFEENAT